MAAVEEGGAVEAKIDIAEASLFSLTPVHTSWAPRLFSFCPSRPYRVLGMGQSRNS
jgi:hypothetical protein